MTIDDAGWSNIPGPDFPHRRHQSMAARVLLRPTHWRRGRIYVSGSLLLLKDIDKVGGRQQIIIPSCSLSVEQGPLDREDRRAGQKRKRSKALANCVTSPTRTA